MNLYVVYQSPRDYPGQVVIRRWWLDRPTEDVWLHETVEQARTMLAEWMPDAVALSRNPGDDPTIVETWL